MTRDEMIAELRRQDMIKQLQASDAPAEEAAPEREEEAWYEDLAEGVGLSGLQTYYGAKDLFTDLSDEEKARLKDWQEDAGQSGWGTAGRVLGEIGQMALPGAAALKGARGLSALTKAGKSMSIINPALAEIGVAAGHGALKLPEEGASRGQEAFQSGLGALGGMGAGKLLKTAVKGIGKTKAAQELLDEGVYLTPGQAADSMSVSMLENAAEVTPFLARGTKKAKEAALESFNANVLKKAVPKAMSGKVTKFGQEGARQMEDVIDNAYKAAWKDASVPPATLRQVYMGAQDAMQNLAKKDSLAIKRILREFEGDIDVAKLDDILRAELKSAGSKRHALSESLKGLRQTLRQGLPDENLAKLIEVDAAYPNYLAAMRASSRAAENKGVFTPQQLIQAGRQVGGVTKAGTGRAPLQDIATAGTETVGQKIGGQPLEFMRRLAGAFPSPPGMRGAGQMLLGQTGPQKAATRYAYDPMAELLRGYVSPARIGAAYEE